MEIVGRISRATIAVTAVPLEEACAVIARSYRKPFTGNRRIKRNVRIVRSRSRAVPRRSARGLSGTLKCLQDLTTGGPRVTHALRAVAGVAGSFLGKRCETSRRD